MEVTVTKTVNRCYDCPHFNSHPQEASCGILEKQELYSGLISHRVAEAGIDPKCPLMKDIIDSMKTPDLIIKTSYWSMIPCDPKELAQFAEDATNEIERLQDMLEEAGIDPDPLKRIINARV